MREDKNILVVEDDSDLCNTIVDSLIRIGYNAHGCNGQREATLRMKNQTYHCILLDIRLGQDSGEDLAEFIRTRKDVMNQKTPIVLVSGNLDKELVQRMGKLVQGALVKPFEMPALLEIVKKFAGSP